MLLPLLAQKLSTTPRSAMELQGAQTSDGIPGGLEVAVLSTHARPQRVDVSKVLGKMPDMSVALATFQLARSLVKEEAPQNVPDKVVTLFTFHLLKSLVKEEASLNVKNKLVTLSTFHLLKSLLKDAAPLNV